MQEDREPEQAAIPDIKPDEMTSGLMCFMKEERECGASCMAFLATPADVPLLSPQQRHCLVIVSAERLARHVVVGVKVMSDALTLFKTAKADKARAEQAKAPEPRG